MSSVVNTPSLILDSGVWDIDRDHSNVEFVSRHLLSRVRGRFTDFAGQIVAGPEAGQSSVAVTIQAASIDTGHAQRDVHLRGPDFLDVERFPTVSFRSTRIDAVGGEDGGLRIEGELTIRDVTQAVVLDVEFLGAASDPWGGTRAGFSARAVIDRDDFGANWNVVLETGGLLVGRKVQLEIEIEAVLRTAS